MHLMMPNEPLSQHHQIERKARIIAFYLPQFHPITENNAWWGPGFTEWTNVTKARPLFKGHKQPQLPRDLGFYDLRLPEVRAQQAEMAKTYGVEGFCYWHYWFSGRRLLERPFEEVLRSGEPNFPFCLGWANESWTGVWHGAPGRRLIEQEYPGEKDNDAHFDYLLRAFLDSRYIRIEGKPLLLIYKPLKVPDPQKIFGQWRDRAAKAGLAGLYIVGVNMLDFTDPTSLGLDGAVISKLGLLAANEKVARMQRTFWGLRRRLPFGSLRVIEYNEAVKSLVPDLKKFNYEAYPCVVPRWDNTPRSGSRGLVLTNSTSDLFREHLRTAIFQVSDNKPEKRLVFLKSWNEWAEGNYIEPDQASGFAYLEALRAEAFK
jgi:hypothetical protein